MKTAVIRVLPDNLFHLDALHLKDYPLGPVKTPKEMAEQLGQIDQLYQDKGLLDSLAQQTLEQYFPKPDEENLRVFL